MRPRTVIEVHRPEAARRLMHPYPDHPAVEVELHQGDTTVRLLFDDVTEMRRVIKEMSVAASELSAVIASRAVKS